MFKHVGLLVRKAELTHEEFTEYWKDTHADVAKQIEGVVRYQQVHPLQAERYPCDGLAELYFETFEALTAALGFEGERDFDPDLPNAARAREDADNFLEISERPKIVGREVVEQDEVDWDTDGLVKVSTFLVRDDRLTHEAFLKRWETEYVPIVAEIPGLVRHARVLPNDPDLSTFDGVSELYFAELSDVPEHFRSSYPSRSVESEPDEFEGQPPADAVLPLASSRRFVGIEHIQKDERE